MNNALTVVRVIARGVLRAVVGLALLTSALAHAATIEGRLSFPSEEIPALVIVAYNLDTRARHVFESPAKARRYRAEVPAGRYYVYALSAEPGAAPLRGAYSAYTVCGQRSPKLMQQGKCAEHRVLEVVLGANDRRTDIDLDDWYLPEDELYKLPAPRER